MKPPAPVTQTVWPWPVSDEVSAGMVVVSRGRVARRLGEQVYDREAVEKTSVVLEWQAGTSKESACLLNL